MTLAYPSYLSKKLSFQSLYQFFDDDLEKKLLQEPGLLENRELPKEWLLTLLLILLYFSCLVMIQDLSFPLKATIYVCSLMALKCLSFNLLLQILYQSFEFNLFLKLTSNVVPFLKTKQRLFLSLSLIQSNLFKQSITALEIINQQEMSFITLQRPEYCTYCQEHHDLKQVYCLYLSSPIRTSYFFPQTTYTRDVF